MAGARRMAARTGCSRPTRQQESSASRSISRSLMWCDAHSGRRRKSPPDASGGLEPFARPRADGRRMDVSRTQHRLDRFDGELRHGAALAAIDHEDRPMLVHGSGIAIAGMTARDAVPGFPPQDRCLAPGVTFALEQIEQAGVVDVADTILRSVGERPREHIAIDVDDIDIVEE